MPYKYPTEKSLANLKKGKKFQKGVSGNPKGRPKLPDLKEVMAKVLGDEKEGMSALEAVVMTVFKAALKGDMKACDMLMARGYGLPQQNVTLEGEVKVSFVREKNEGN